MALIYGIAAVAILWWLSNKFAVANTAAMARAIKIVGGVVALGAAVLMGLRGRLDMALLVGSLGLWLLGWSVPSLPFGRSQSAPSPGRVSRVRSAMIDMELDHDTGDLNGTVLAGVFAGHRLADLGEPALRQLLSDCRTSDPDGVRLLEAYLDRRFPGWREHTEDHADPRPGAKSGAMTEEEAYQILGLQPGAGVEQISAAHRSLMKKLHPDQGGSTYLAARVNQAKDILLSRHR